MNETLKNTIKGKHSRLAMFIAYVGRELKDEHVRNYADFYGLKPQSIWGSVNQLNREGVLGVVWVSHWQWKYVFRQGYFFDMAVYMLENEQGLILEFGRIVRERSRQADFLWAVAEGYQKGEIDMSCRLDGDFPPEEASLYLLSHFHNECMEEFVLGLDAEELKDLISMSLVKSLMTDHASVGYFDRLLEIIGLYKEEGAMNAIARTDFLADLVKCYRFFYDGMILPHTGMLPTYPYDILTAIKALYEGKSVKSVGYFLEALKARNKTCGDSKEKNLFRNPLMCFYLILAYKKSDTDKDRTRVQQFLNKKLTIEYKDLQQARILARWVGGAISQKTLVSDLYWMYHTSRNRMSVALSEIIIGYYNGFEAEGDAPPIPIPSHIPEYAILRHELSPYLPLEDDEKAYLTELFGGVPVLPTIRRIEKWEEVLSDMSRVVEAAAGKKVEQPVNKERIGYFMNHDGSELEYRIQTRLKNGTWGSGKKAGQTDFFAGAIPCMDETDRMIAAKARNWYHSAYVRAIDCLPFLIGSDRVYSGASAPYRQVNVIEEKPYLSIRRSGKRYKLESNIPKWRDTTSSDKTVVRQIDETTFSVINIDDVQRKLLNSFLQLETLPEQSTEMLLQLLPGLSKHIEIHSDLLEGGSSLENIEGDAKIHCRIDPEGDEYLVRFFVRPLEGGNMAFAAGTGDKVIYDQNKGTRYQVTRDIRTEKTRIETVAGFLEDLFDSDMFDIGEVLALNPMEMLSLVEWAGERSEEIVLEWPEGKKIKVSKVEKSSVGVSSGSGEDWFSIEGEITLKDGDSVKIHELLRLISSEGMTGRYVLLNDETFIALTDALRRQMKRLEAISQIGRGDVRVSKFNVGLLAEMVRGKQPVVEGAPALDDLMKKIEEAGTLEPEVPKGLNATLRDYQYEGFRWMVRLAHWGAGACLADDMGLGKTVQAIAFMLHKAAQGPSLVVAPASVVMNWASELARFAPGLRVSVLNDADDRHAVIESAVAGDVVLTTYGLLQQEDEALAKIHWNVACLDEAHTIKNRQTKTSAAAMGLDARYRLILTGTPVQNYLGELWNLLHFLNPGLLGSYEQFSRKFISNENADLSSLRKMVQPFILRRTKTQVLDELPDKTEIIRRVSLSDMEILAYESIRGKVQSEIESENKVTVNVLAEITRLRQAACSMSLVDKKWTSGCSKIEVFGELIKDIVSSGNRVLVFSQFTSFLSMALAELDSSGLGYFYLDGSTPIKKREQMVREFQAGSRRIFVVSLKAGGLGLNLTGANYVIHLDPWWNPAIEQQATDRAHRIGQKQPVTVYHLISGNTIEEKILRLHKTKRDLSDTFLSGTDVAHALTIDDLRGLVEGD